MKMMMIATAALMLGGAAIAQDAMQPSTGTQTQPTTGTPTAPADTTTTQQPMQDMPMQSDTQTQQQTQPQTQPLQQDPAAQPMQPQTQPMTDSSNMATGQPSSGMSNGNMGAMAAPAAGGEYPRCSRTVTDRCIQGPAARRRR